MLNKDNISNLIDNYINENNLFIVEITISADNDIEIIIDSFNTVTLDNCTKISRIIDQNVDREMFDYSLTVSSSGLDMPLKILKQYQKYIDKEVSIVFKTGKKIVAKLLSASEERIEIEYTSKVKIEGQKKSQPITVKESFLLNEIKSTKPFINFK